MNYLFAALIAAIWVGLSHCFSILLQIYRILERLSLDNHPVVLLPFFLLLFMGPGIIAVWLLHVDQLKVKARMLISLIPSFAGGLVSTFGIYTRAFKPELSSHPEVMVDIFLQVVLRTFIYWLFTMVIAALVAWYKRKHSYKSE